MIYIFFRVLSAFYRRHSDIRSGVSRSCFFRWNDGEGAAGFGSCGRESVFHMLPTAPNPFHPSHLLLDVVFRKNPIIHRSNPPNFKGYNHLALLLLQ